MTTTKKQTEFAICIADTGYDDLREWKVYRVLPDEKAAELDCIRAIDESGEDYLYPADRFAALDIPRAIRGKLLQRRPAGVRKNGPSRVTSGR